MISLNDYGVWATIIAAIITGVVSVILGQWLIENSKKKNRYEEPFTKWCISFSGALHEFEEIFIEKKYIRLEPTSKLIHFWSMHMEVEAGYKWLAMVKKDDVIVGEHLDDFMDSIEIVWHNLENKNINILLGQDNANDFRRALVTLAPDEIKKYVTEIESTLKIDNYQYDRIRKYFHEKIP